MERSKEEKARIHSEIRYAPLAHEDLPRLSQLIGGMHEESESVLRVRNYGPDYYDWMYYQNPAGPAIVFAGKHRDEIVTSFAITPKRVQIGGQVVLTGKTMDMFTHPEYQGLGLIKEVTSRVFEEAKSKGISMWYVTPPNNSYPIFLNKWKYVESFQVNYIVRVLNYAAVLGKSVRPPLAGKVGGAALNLLTRLLPGVPDPDPQFEFRDEREFGPETDALWRRCGGYQVALVRDAAYPTWRYLQNPDRYEVRKVYAKGELHGILVMKYTRRRGLKVAEFVDCVTASEDRDTRRAIFRYGLRLARSEGCAFAQNWAIQDSAWEKEMMEFGLNRRRRKMALLFSPGAVRKEWYERDAWYLTPGDGNDL